MEDESLPVASTKRPRVRARKGDAPVKQQAESADSGATAPVLPRRSIQKRLVVSMPVDSSKDYLEEMSCILCNRQLENREALEHHYMSNHTRLWKPEFPEGVDNNASLAVILKKLGCLKCQTCLKEFNGVQYYKFHREWCGREREEVVCELCNKIQKAMWMGHHRRACTGGGRKSSKERPEEMVRPGQRRSAAMKALETLEAFKDGNEMVTDDNQKDVAFHVPADEGASQSEDDENMPDDDDDGSRTKSTRRDGKMTKKELNPLPESLSGVNKLCFRIELDHQLVSQSVSCCATWLPFTGTWDYSSLPAGINDELLAGCLPSVKSLHLQYCNDREKCSHVVEALQSAICSDDIFCCNITAPISTMAWCPVPLMPVPQQQYLAVALQHIQEYVDHYNHTSAIQLWDFGYLERPNDACPSCVTLIKHDYGQVWDLKWCPYGAWQAGTTETNSETRLGMLAVAASDGNAYILSIPRPIAQPNLPGFRVATQRSVVKLSGGTSPCLCVEWQHKGTGIVVAGFVDGTICLWSLDNQDCDATSRGHVVLSPYECIQVQPTCVRTIRWSPNSPYLFATTSLLDRCINIWDTRDLTSPHTVIDHHGMVPTDTEWGTYYDGIFVTSDDICKVNGENPLYFFESGYFGLAPRSVQTTYATSWSVSFCNWTSCIVTSNDRGSVFLTPVPNLYKSRKASEFRIYELMKLTHCRELAQQESEAAATGCDVELVMANIGSLTKQYKPQKVTNETVLSSSASSKAAFKLVKFNPNPGCHTWLASASSCGLLVVTCLRSTASQQHATDLEAARCRLFAKSSR